ncbi:unnamed protein product [Ectocarpus sp. 8 AP-2014]
MYEQGKQFLREILYRDTNRRTPDTARGYSRQKLRDQTIQQETLVHNSIPFRSSTVPASSQPWRANVNERVHPCSGLLAFPACGGNASCFDYKRSLYGPKIDARIMAEKVSATTNMDHQRSLRGEPKGRCRRKIYLALRTNEAAASGTAAQQNKSKYLEPPQLKGGEHRRRIHPKEAETHRRFFSSLFASHLGQQNTQT